MARTARERTCLAFSVMIGAIPVMFAFIRAYTTGTDFRAVWMLVGAIAGAVLISAAGRSSDGQRAQRSAVTMFAVCTLVAGGVGMLLGARGMFGVWVVAAAFGFCIATSVALFALSRRHPV